MAGGVRGVGDVASAPRMAAWSLGLWGTPPSMAENGPSSCGATPFRCPGGRVWGGGGCFFAGGGGGLAALGVGWKRLASRDSLASSLVLVLLAKPYGRAPNHPQPAHVSRVSEKSPRSPGHRLAAAWLAGRAKRARRRFRGAPSRRGGGRAYRGCASSPEAHTHTPDGLQVTAAPRSLRARRGMRFGGARKRALSPTRRAAAPRRSARPGARAGKRAPLAPT